MAIHSSRLGTKAQMAILGMLVGLVCAANARGQSDSERRAVIKKVEHSVAKVVVELEHGQGHGSGYIVDESGVIVTNAHVIKVARRKDFKRVYVTFPADGDKKEYATEGFLDVQPNRDLALLRIEPEGRKLDPLKLCRRPPSPGETVFTFGSPLGLDNTPAFGHVTACRTGREIDQVFSGLAGKGYYEKEQGYSLDTSWVQHDAAMSPGNSGGPLLNMQGEVLGLNTWHIPSGENLNFATSAANIKAFLADASRLVKSWSELPPWQGAGDPDREAPPGNAGVTLAAWREFGKAKNELSDKIDAADGKLQKIPDLDSRAPMGLQNQRNKKLAVAYRNYAKAYRDYGIKARAANKEMAHPLLIKLIIQDAESHEQIASIYEMFAADVREQRGSRDVERGPLEIKLKALSELRSQFDIVRINLGRIYGAKFPSLEEIRKESDRSASDKANSEKNAFRLWISANGKFHVEAKLVRVSGNSVILETRDGRTIRVKIEKLCDDDQKFVESKAKYPSHRGEDDSLLAAAVPE